MRHIDGVDPQAKPEGQPRNGYLRRLARIKLQDLNMFMNSSVSPRDDKLNKAWLSFLLGIKRYTTQQLFMSFNLNDAA